MTGQSETHLPQSPETQGHDALDQQATSDAASSEPDLHRGAVEDDVVPVIPPMRSAEEDVDDSAEVDLDPGDELTPG